MLKSLFDPDAFMSTLCFPLSQRSADDGFRRFYLEVRRLLSGIPEKVVESQ